MDSDYYILEDGEQRGPLSFDEIIEMEPDIHSRILSPNADGWQDACDLPEFYEYFLALGVNFPTADNLASFWWRLLAYLIDSVLLSIVMVVLLTILTAKGIKFNLQSYHDLLILQLILYGLLIIYNSICEASAMEGSVGKRVCNMVVVDADGMGLSYPNALLRSVGKVVSLFFYGVGFLSIFWSEHRQAMHDYLAKTYVIKRDR